MWQKERHLICLLHKTSHHIKWELNSGLKDYQMTSAQWRVLMDLKYQEDIKASLNNMTPGSIAERLNVERPGITRTIDTLIQEGLVKKEDNPSDKRSQLIVLTQQARDMLPWLMTAGNKVIEKTFEGFQKDEIQEFTNYLTRMISNLHKE
jgi:DNA-binding MarR family transcriptional regulator